MSKKKNYKREIYLRKIRGFYHNTELIKVITGVRRCGKSILLDLVKDELLMQGISINNIVDINLDKRPYKSIRTAQQLEKTIDSLLPETKDKIYLFLDEVQNIKGFEEVLESYRLEGNISIFVTGSNSYLLSSEMATKLTGRKVVIEVLPLNYIEYEEMKAFYNLPINSNQRAEFDSYLREGGFPGVLLIENQEDKKTYVTTLVDEIYNKDIKRRLKIRNTDAFNALRDFIIGNFGNVFTKKSLLKAFSTNFARPIKKATIMRYLNGLIDAKIIYECKRFDTKSKKAIGGEVKYYLSDLSFYFASSTSSNIPYGPALENVIHNFYKGLNKPISIGIVGNLECDFIVRKDVDEYIYLQIAKTLYEDEEIQMEKIKEGRPLLIDREYRSLEQIRDNYPKYVITLNDDTIIHRNGIIHSNIIPFLENEIK